jgi:hypothetical protein
MANILVKNHCLQKMFYIVTFKEKVMVKKSHETDPLNSQNITAELKKMCNTQEALLSFGL